MAAKKKAVQKTRQVPKTRTNAYTGTPETYYVTETFTEYVTDYSSSSSDCGSSSGSYDSGSYSSGDSGCY